MATEESVVVELEAVVPSDESTQADTETNVTSDSATDDAANAETQGEETPEVKAEKKSGFDKRIEKLNKRVSDREQEIEYWKREALKQGTAAPVNVQAQAPVGKPTFSQYNDVEAYTEALTDWKLDQKLAVREQQSHGQSVIQQYNSRVEKVLEKHPDFREVLAEANDVQTAPEITQVILESDVGPEMAYFLANNVAEVERINALPPYKRLIALGKLEAKFGAEPVEKSKPVSKAPTPPTTVKGSHAVVDDFSKMNDPNISQKEYNRLREAQLRARAKK